MKAQKWVVRRHFQGEPKDGDLVLEEEELPTLQDGDVLFEAECWSVDPYMRLGISLVPVGDTMIGQCLARVVESRNSGYPVGSKHMVSTGWRTHTVCNPDTLPEADYFGQKGPVIQPAPDVGNLGGSTTLGVLGMPGATAYIGFLEVCRPKAGETVLVTGAAGAVGSLVGQIAKIKGCKVIGFAGSDAKCKYLRDELGFDFAFNYKTDDPSTVLTEAAPDGIDCYFDNVGGSFSTNVIMNHMRVKGRIAVVGNISRYNNDSATISEGPELYGFLLVKQLTMTGFIVYSHFDGYPNAFNHLRQWIEQGKLKFREHSTAGFENMYSAFRGMLKGDNIGKAVVIAANSTKF